MYYGLFMEFLDTFLLSVTVSLSGPRKTIVKSGQGKQHVVGGYPFIG